VIATGSDIARLKGIEIDEKRIVSSTGALSLDKVPSSLLIVGAGVIGLELGSVWHRLGAKVTVVEFLDRILPGMDGEIANNSSAFWKSRALRSSSAPRSPASIPQARRCRPRSSRPRAVRPKTIEADVVLVCIGRVPYTDGLG
jgi:Pyruvate/2-oxoglutarate dehydrogenase complex, dihydrolipoamide dehydrogenase (E3) component, and related enzymes